jgi:hypothetical protein
MMLTAKDKSRLMEYLSVQRGRESVVYRVVQVQDQRAQYMLVTGRRTEARRRPILYWNAAGNVVYAGCQWGPGARVGRARVATRAGTEASRLKGYNNVVDLWENSRVNLFDFFEDYAELEGPLEDVVTAAAKRKRRRS